MSRAAVARTVLSSAAILTAVAAASNSGEVVHSNDTSAWAKLQVLASRQAEFAHAVSIDVDGDGRGEFAFFAELSSAVALPRRESVLDPPLLSGSWRVVRPDGTVSSSGYRFRVFLPDAQGHGVREAGTPPLPPREPGSG